jgi:metal-dependent HD superfamily phosphatase/phosphodiesterase
MAKPKETKLKVGWAAEREAKDQPPIKSLTTEAAIDALADKTSARSGRAYAPGIGKSS